MCSRMFVSSLLLSLLAGCGDPGYLVATSPGDVVASGQSDGTQTAALHYTRHRATATDLELVPLRISGPFRVGDRAKILRAVNEWNVALNGFVRFDIVVAPVAPAAGARQPRPWVIMAAHGGGLRVAPGPAIALAQTQPIPGAGGLMIVHVDRIGTRDLGGVVMHELGHVLGLGHDTGGGLMATYYHPTAQQCVDRAAVEAIATRRRLPVNQLNWCETNVAGAQR